MQRSRFSSRDPAPFQAAGWLTLAFLAVYVLWVFSNIRPDHHIIVLKSLNSNSAQLPHAFISYQKNGHMDGISPAANIRVEGHHQHIKHSSTSDSVIPTGSTPSITTNSITYGTSRQRAHETGLGVDPATLPKRDRQSAATHIAGVRHSKLQLEDTNAIAGHPVNGGVYDSGPALDLPGDDILQVLDHVPRLGGRSAGSQLTAFTDQGGTLLSWGVHGWRLGRMSRHNDVPLPALHTLQVISIAASRHSLVATAEGAVYSMGHNDSRGGGGHGSPPMKNSGQLGRLAGTLAPGKVLGDLEGKFVVQVAAGRFHSLAVTSEGALFSWGLNDVGQLGRRAHGARGENDPSACTLGATCHDGLPRRVEALAGIRIVAAEAGRYTSMAVDDRGRLFVWGYDGCGSDGHMPDRAQLWRPRRVGGALRGRQVLAFDAGYVFWLAATADGALFSCNSGDDGYAGTLANKRDGNAAGELGRTGNPYIPLQVDVLEGQRVVAVAAGREHALAITDKGTGYAWGGQHGAVPQIIRGTPQDHAFLFPAAGEFFSLLANSTSVFGWGSNEHYATGVGRHNPVQIIKKKGRDRGTVPQPSMSAGWFAETAAEERSVLALAAGFQHSLAIVRKGSPRTHAWPVVRPYSGPPLQEQEAGPQPAEVVAGTPGATTAAIPAGAQAVGASQGAAPAVLGAEVQTTDASSKLDTPHVEGAGAATPLPATDAETPANGATAEVGAQPLAASAFAAAGGLLADADYASDGRVVAPAASAFVITADGEPGTTSRTSTSTAITAGNSPTSVITAPIITPAVTTDVIAAATTTTAGSGTPSPAPVAAAMNSAAGDPGTLTAPIITAAMTAEAISAAAVREAGSRTASDVSITGVEAAGSTGRTAAVVPVNLADLLNITTTLILGSATTSAAAGGNQEAKAAGDATRAMDTPAAFGDAVLAAAGAATGPSMAQAVVDLQADEDYGADAADVAAASAAIPVLTPGNEATMFVGHGTTPINLAPTATAVDGSTSPAAALPIQKASTAAATAAAMVGGMEPTATTTTHAATGVTAGGLAAGADTVAGADHDASLGDLTATYNKPMDTAAMAAALVGDAQSRLAQQQ